MGCYIWYKTERMSLGEDGTGGWYIWYSEDGTWTWADTFDTIRMRPWLLPLVQCERDYRREGGRTFDDTDSSQKSRSRNTSALASSSSCSFLSRSSSSACCRNCTAINTTQVLPVMWQSRHMMTSCLQTLHQLYFCHRLKQQFTWHAVNELWSQFPKTPSSFTFNADHTCKQILTDFHRNGEGTIKYVATRDVGQCPTWWPPCRI